MNKVRYGRADKTAKPEAKEDMGMRAKYDRMKKGCDCQDGSKGSCKCNKKDMGSMKKSPYADGCGYKEDTLASDLNEVLTGVKMDGMGVKKFSEPEEVVAGSLRQMVRERLRPVGSQVPESPARRRKREGKNG